MLNPTLSSPNPHPGVTLLITRASTAASTMGSRGDHAAPTSGCPRPANSSSLRAWVEISTGGLKWNVELGQSSVVCRSCHWKASCGAVSTRIVLFRKKHGENRHVGDYLLNVWTSCCHVSLPEVQGSTCLIWIGLVSNQSVNGWTHAASQHDLSGRCLDCFLESQHCKGPKAKQNVQTFSGCIFPTFPKQQWQDRMGPPCQATQNTY